MKQLSYTINFLASITVVIIAILNLDTLTLAAISLLIWAISPYLFTIFMTKRSNKDIVVNIVFGVSLFLVVGGLYLLVDAMYIHTDPQGGLAFIVVPMYQWMILLIIMLPLYLINKKGKRKNNE